MNKTRILEKARACDLMIEVFALLLAGADADKKRAAELIRELDATARRDLRAALQGLDHMLDDIALEGFRSARIEQKK